MRHHPFVRSICFLGALVFGGSTFAQDLEIHGNLDFYFQHSDEGARAAGSKGPKELEGRSFDRHAGEPTLNFAEVSFKKKIDRVQARLDLAGGQMVDQLSGGSASAATESSRHITQATLTYQASERWSFTAGKFYTNIGFEQTRAKDNWQYSRSYLFNYGPFWHQGGSVTAVIIPEKLTGTLFLLNGWEGRSSEQANSDFTVAANLNYVPSAGLTLNYNYIGGNESVGMGRRELHELNALYQINEQLSAALDFQTASQRNVGARTMQWHGVAAYFKAQFSEFYALSPRVEYFDDQDGFAVASGFSGNGLVPQKITAWTLTNTFNLGNGLEARLEGRFDESTSDQFFKTSGGGNSDTQTSYTLAVLYGF